VLPPIARIGRADTEDVVCFFSRDDSVIRCEVRPVDDGGGYELVIDHPDAVVQVERFSGAEALNRRWMDVEGRLLRQGWRGPAPRQQLKNQ
jgi:hypothetical protein